VGQNDFDKEGSLAAKLYHWVLFLLLAVIFVCWGLVYLLQIISQRFGEAIVQSLQRLPPLE
jgi:hypothetical protein